MRWRKQTHPGKQRNILRALSARQKVNHHWLA